MHMFDPNGSIHTYRRERRRRENIYTILFAIGFGCALIFLTSGAMVVLSLHSK